MDAEIIKWRWGELTVELNRLLDKVQESAGTDQFSAAADELSAWIADNQKEMASLKLLRNTF